MLTNYVMNIVRQINGSVCKIKIYRNIILLVVVLYECKTWSLTSWEGHRLRVFENRV